MPKKLYGAMKKAKELEKDEPDFSKYVVPPATPEELDRWARILGIRRITDKLARPYSEVARELYEEKERRKWERRMGIKH